MGEYNWRDRTEIERWIRDYQEKVDHSGLDFTGLRDPIEELGMRYDRGDFQGENRRAVGSYLKLHNARQYHVSEEARADREERTTIATEDAARSAKKSAKWAGWAIVISLAALLVAALGLNWK